MEFPASSGGGGGNLSPLELLMLLGQRSQKGSCEGLFRAFGLVMDMFKETLEQQGPNLDWILSRRKGIWW